MNSTSEYWIINIKNIDDINITDNMSLYGRIYVTVSAIVELIDNIKKIWL